MELIVHFRANSDRMMKADNSTAIKFAHLVGGFGKIAIFKFDVLQRRHASSLICVNGWSHGIERVTEHPRGVLKMLDPFHPGGLGEAIAHQLPFSYPLFTTLPPAS